MKFTAQLLNTLETKEHEPMLGLAPLMKMAYSGVDLTSLGNSLLERASLDATDNNALMDLSIVLQLRGDPTTAMAIQRQALQQQQLYTLPAKNGSAAIRLLAIMAPGTLIANTPLEFLVENSDIELQMLYVSPDLPLPESLPEHDIAIVAASELEGNMPILQQLQDLTEFWPRPVLNDPVRIPSVCRDAASDLLKSVPGVEIKHTIRLDRLSIEQLGKEEISLSSILESEDYPIIIRPIDSHAGKGLSKINQPSDILEYLKTMPAEAEFYISKFVDYSESDGMFRKARIVVIDGKPFVAHMAVSSKWMVHYLNAGMTESVAKRAEEECFMSEFENDFGARHAKAINGITDQLGLDYYAIDCAETADGKLLVFEVGNAMVVHTMDPEDIFPYKKPQMRRVYEAFRAMLVNVIERNKPWRMAPNNAKGSDAATNWMPPN